MGEADHVVGGPEGPRLGGVARALKLRREPGLARVGPLSCDAPGLAAGKAVDGVLLRAVLEGQLILLPLPRETAGAGAVGEGEENRDAAAPRAGVVEECGVPLEQCRLLGPFA